MGTLEIVAKASARDAVLLAKTLPAFSGSETEDLICGGCGQTIAAGVSARTLRRSHPEGNRLIVRCACKAYNVVAGALPRRRAKWREGRG
jgi:hypothetical protein